MLTLEWDIIIKKHNAKQITFWGGDSSTLSFSLVFQHVCEDISCFLTVYDPALSEKNAL